jgi:hypothetical protein
MLASQNFAKKKIHVKRNRKKARECNLFNMIIMSYRYYFTILLLLSTKTIFSQKCFTVYDSISKIEIPYANIWKENKIYSNTDLDGKFCISENEAQNEFKISCIGYKTKNINTSKNSVFLSLDEIALKEIVIIKPSYKEKVKLGNHKGNNIALTATNDLQMAEIGRVFTLNDSDEHFFNKLKFNTFSSQPNRVIGIKIYSLSENNTPNELISNENIICNIKKGYHTTTVDLSKYSLSAPKNGFFVSIQILLIDQNKQYGEHNKYWFFYEPSIGATSNTKDASYYSMSEQDIWKKHENCQLNIEVELTN